MEATILTCASPSSEPEIVPPRFAGRTPALAVLLPNAKYIELMRGEDERSFTYHLLMHPEYDMLDPIAFDADAFVEAVLA